MEKGKREEGNGKGQDREWNSARGEPPAPCCELNLWAPTPILFMSVSVFVSVCVCVCVCVGVYGCVGVCVGPAVAQAAEAREAERANKSRKHRMNFSGS